MSARVPVASAVVGSCDRFGVRVMTSDGVDGLGSGVLLAPHVVATCRHVVEDPPEGPPQDRTKVFERVTVSRADGRSVLACVKTVPRVGYYDDVAFLLLDEPLAAADDPYPALLSGVTGHAWAKLHVLLREDYEALCSCGFFGAELRTTALTLDDGHDAGAKRLVEWYPIKQSHGQGRSGGPVWLVPSPADANGSAWGSGLVIGLVVQSPSPREWVLGHLGTYAVASGMLLGLRDRLCEGEVGTLNDVHRWALLGLRVVDPGQAIALLERRAQDQPASSRPEQGRRVAEPGWNDRPQPVSPFPGHAAQPADARELPMLIVSARREGDRVRLSYRTGQDAKIVEERSVAWDPTFDQASRLLREGTGPQLQELGVRLGALLLGTHGEPEHHAVMRRLFSARSADEATTPLAGAARCRLVLDEALDELPWRLTAVCDREGRAFWLTDHGWTFEHAAAERPRCDMPLRDRYRFVFVVPRSGKLAAAGKGLVERAVGQLEVMWPQEAKGLGALVACAHGPVDLERALERIKPHVVVFFGRAFVEGGPSLELWGNEGTSELEALERFVERLEAAKVELLMLATRNPVSLPLACRGRLPCVVLPATAAEPETIVDTVLSWLDAMLGEGLDPVRALHRPPARGPTRWWGALRAHADFGRWTIPHARAVADDTQARHLLDREPLRAMFIRRVDGLVKHERRRVEAFVVHGASHDRVDWLGEQLWEEYREDDPSWRARRVRVRFPRAEGGLEAQLERMVKERLEIGGGISPRAAIEDEARAHEWPERPFVYWLDWEAPPGGLKRASLRAWIQLVTRVLPSLVEEVRNVRMIATLGLVPKDRRRLHDDVEAMVKESSDREHRWAEVMVFDELGAVTMRHVRDYLDKTRRCPASLVQAVAEEVMRRTDGVFSRTVELLEALECVHGWQALVDERPDPMPVAARDDEEEI